MKLIRINEQSYKFILPHHVPSVFSLWFPSDQHVQVKLEKVEEAFAEATAAGTAPSTEKGGDGGSTSGSTGMTYEQFDAFLASVRTMQVCGRETNLLRGGWINADRTHQIVISKA